MPSTDELAALRAIVEGTARHTGQEFFQSLVRHLALAVGTRYAFVAEFAGGTMARTLAFWFRDRITDNIEWDVIGTPCEDVVRGNLCHYPAGVSQRFPEDRLIVEWGIESYLGVPLCDAQGRHLGHLAVFDERPMPAEPRKLFTFRIFAARAAAEFERLQFETRLRESEQRWRGLVEALPQLVWSATPDGARDYFSTQWMEYTGVPVSDLLGWRWLELLHPDDREPIREFWTDSVAGRGPYDVEYRARRSDGEYRWFRARGVPIRDGAGNICKWFGTCTDVTTSKQLEEELRQVNARLDLAVRGSNLAIWEFDMPDGRIENSHPTFINVWESLGYDPLTPPTDFASGFALAVHPDDQERLRCAIQEFLFSDSREFETEYRVRHKDGSDRWRLARGVALRDSEGRPIRFIGSFVEITDLKRAEEALRESEQRWRSLTEALPQLVWSATPDGACDYFSAQWTQHTGVPESDLMGWRWLATLHPDDREPTRRLWTDSVAGRGPYDVEYRVRRSDGVYRWFKTRGTPIRDSQGRIFKWFGTCTDITDDKQAEAVLRISEERRRLILDNAHDAFVAMSADGLITEWNRHAEITFGWPRTEAVGRVLSETIIPPRFREAHNHGLAHFLATGEGPVLNRVIEVRALRRDGREFPAEISIAPVRLGEQYLFAAFIRDVTERKRAEEELRRAKEAAEAANRAKDEFLANVSHEIRTPMNAILGMTDLALDTLLTEDQRQYLMTVKSAADALLGIINDILDFAKIEAGKLELDPADFSLRAAVGDTLRALATRAHKKGLELACNVQSDVPDALIGDAGRLRQVLLNLVGNAIKFTEHGEVVVLVENAGGPAPEGEVSLHFAVTDTGIGIPPEKQAKIFQAFEQEDTSTTRKHGGTGLGLTIAARLAALMDGGITVDSVPGQGSTFAFTARFGRQLHPPATTAASPPVVLRGLPVLIVDDNATNRHILEEWLRCFSMEPMAAGDGVTTMDALWHGVAQGLPYPLVLLDGRMPDIDGLALAAKIRQRAELSATHIILLTSGDRPGDLIRARQLGIAATLLKPIQQRELMETILRVMGRQEDLEGLLVSPPAVRPRIPEGLVGVPLRILVAEDNDFNRDLLEHLLARLGLSATMAVTGREALALLEREPFDLLLLDIHMPELDGFQVVGAIRERERTAGGHLPVIALTARSRKEDRDACLRAGMDECLVKPYSAADLWAAMDRVLRIRGQRSEVRDQKSEVRGQKSAVSADPIRLPLTSDLRPLTSDLDLFDPAVLLAACGGDPTMLRKMCRSLQSRVPEHLTAIREALQNQDVLRLREEAHKFCGMLSAFSTVAGDQAGILEDLAARGLLTEGLPVVEQLDQSATELARLAGGLTIETLRKQAEPAGGPNRTAGS
jgi:PAS domain S-box-containing protein